MRKLFALVLALVLAGAPPAQAAEATITPGVAWKDTSGNPIQAHGGGMIKVGATYYWFGEDKTGENQNNAFFRNVTCYSSTDLQHWKFESNALTRQASGDLGPKRVIERPKVIFNQATGLYVMWMHVDDKEHTVTKVGVATSPTVCGPYTYRGSIKPQGNISLDIQLFVDDDGSGYLFGEARAAGGLRLYKLSADYTKIDSLVAVLEDFESPAIFKQNGRYYVLGSHRTGWRTNDNMYTSSTSLSKGWATWKLFAPKGSKTFNSQTTFVLPVVGTKGTTFMFMGDRWQPDSLGTSPYVWLPLAVNGTSVSLAWYDKWFIDTTTGLWHK
ncbi:family 43 glycosylhydrolase [Lentzea tibetensis]|uniref:family 43 glycosylhydrolase n=1 Tax=Lentzea tibetensis TaxID=2591470 RepID=UPI001647C1B4|nr:family 43 glycosylhydrolase [Lentzea tibetensis]